MSMTAYVKLERTGAVRRAAEVEPSGNGLNYGQALPYLIDSLDPLCEALGVTPVSGFLDAPAETGREPSWHDAADGLRTFSALLTELIFRWDSGLPDDLARASVLWEVRAFELVLRSAAHRQERFYIEV
jgi:hypothetical protein